MLLVSPQSPERWLTSPLGQLQLLIALAIAVGGGGSAYGLRNLFVELAALLILALQRERVWVFARQAPRSLLLLVTLTIAVPLCQLVPLPASLWQSLPGREPAIAAFEIAGVSAQQWFPISLDRGRTLSALLALLAPLTILAVGWGMPSDEQYRLARFAAFAALAALALGIVQLASGNSSAQLFAMTPKPDVLYATFANRNSTAAFLVIALLMLSGSPRFAGPAGLPVAVAGGALLGLGVILTQSRSGMVLLALALGFILLRTFLTLLARSKGGDGTPRPALVASLLAAMLMVAAALGSAALGGRAADSLSRFGDTQTDRPHMWEDGAFAAGEYWPIGSGMGTFDEVFQLHESLEYVTPRRAGRVHSDVLEIVIEAGIAGPLLVLGWLIWAAQASLRAPPHWRWTALGAGTGVLALLLQSLLDYPLRNQTLLCFAGLLILLLAHSRRKAPA